MSTYAYYVPQSRDTPFKIYDCEYTLPSLMMLFTDSGYSGPALDLMSFTTMKVYCEAASRISY